RAHSVAGAMEQRLPHRRFEPPKPHTHRRLADEEPPRRLGERSLLDRQDERFEIHPFHCSARSKVPLRSLPTPNQLRGRIGAAGFITTVYDYTHRYSIAQMAASAGSFRRSSFSRDCGTALDARKPRGSPFHHPRPGGSVMTQKIAPADGKLGVLLPGL